jgi:FkbM family methyltransferase
MLATIQEYTFLAAPLGPVATVLDLGAHTGEFSREISQRYRARCIAIEPVAEYAAAIPPEVSAHRLAIGDRDGLAEISVSADHPGGSNLYGHGRITSTERVRQVRFDTLLEEQGLRSVELVKVDIEGAERALFAAPDETLLRVAQFTVEFHDFVGLLDSKEVRGIVRRLRALGFQGVKITRTNYSWLFFQPERCGVRHPQLLRLGTRNRMYVGRNVRRVLHLK